MGSRGCAADGCGQEALTGYRRCYHHEKVALVDEFCGALIALPLVVFAVGLFFCGAVWLGRGLS